MSLKDNMTFEKLYEEHAAMVFNLCLNYVQNQEDAEEITQDVFVKIHEKFSSYKGDSSLKTWVYRVTINQCLDFIKARTRKKRFGINIPILQAGPQELKTEMNHPGIQLEDKEALEALFTKINTLPLTQKTALLLKVVEDLAIKEIAEVMDTSAKSVESLLSRARTNLKKKKM